MPPAPLFREYRAPRQAIADAALKAVRELGHQVVDAQPGLLVFTTGPSWFSWRGQRMRATVTESGGTTRIQISGTLNRPVLQLYAWGEAEFVARDVLDQMLLGEPHPVVAQNLRDPRRMAKNAVVLLLIVSLVLAVSLVLPALLR
jgi:hypothetical protein